MKSENIFKDFLWYQHAAILPEQSPGQRYLSESVIVYYHDHPDWDKKPGSLMVGFFRYCPTKYHPRGWYIYRTANGNKIYCGEKIGDKILRWTNIPSEEKFMIAGIVYRVKRRADEIIYKLERIGGDDEIKH